MVPLTYGMVDIEHICMTLNIKCFLYTLQLSQTSNSDAGCSGANILPKNGVFHLDFEGVPAQYQPKYFLTECILSQYKCYLSK